MSASTSQATSGGVGLGSMLFVALLVCKLVGVPAVSTMSWPLVISSLFWPAGVILAIVGAGICVGVFGVVLGKAIDQLARGGGR